MEEGSRHRLAQILEDQKVNEVMQREAGRSCFRCAFALHWRAPSAVARYLFSRLVLRRFLESKVWQ